MKKIILIFITVIAWVNAFAQLPDPSCSDCSLTIPDACDLVCNASFETYITCPTSTTPTGGGLTVCAWQNATYASPDYFSTCATVGSGVNIPTEGTARTGNAMAGFYAKGTGGSYPEYWHEYIYTVLRYPMVAGVTYEVSFWVKNRTSLNASNFGMWITDGTTMGLTDASSTNGFIRDGSGTPITPQVLYTGTPITSAMGWTQITGTYTATSAFDRIIIGSWASTFTGVGSTSFYFLDDVSVKPKISVATASPTTVCPGGPTTLSLNPTLPSPSSLLAWSPSGTISCTNCNPTTATPTVATTYAATITYFPGCVSTPTVSVSMYPVPVITGISATPGSISPPTTTTSNLSVSATGTGLTYSWLPSGTLSNPSISNPVASPTVTTTYTVTVTNSNGCTATSAVTVTVYTPCNLSAPITIPAGSFATTFFPSVSSAVGLDFIVNGTFTVDKNFDFDDCNLLMMPGSKINVGTGLTPVTLEFGGKTHAYGCTEMWEGIYAVNLGTFRAVNGVFIEDAKKAVNVAQGGYAFLEHVLFNRNYTAVDLTTNTSVTSPVDMNSCVVTSRSIPSYASVASNPDAGTVWPIITSYTGANMKLPYTSYKSIYGVHAVDVKTVTIDPGSSFNAFDNLGCGIIIEVPSTTLATTTTIRGNKFQNMINGASCLPWPCTSLLGIGIYGTASASSTVNNTMIIGGTIASQANTFDNIFSAIELSRFKTNTIFKSIINNSSTIAGGSLYGIGKYGIKITPITNHTIDVEENSITNCVNGIWVVRGGTVTTSSKINLNSPITANASGYCTTAINVQDNSSGSSAIPTLSQINNNVISNAQNGILTTYLKQPTDIMSNKVTVLYASSGGRYGIKTDLCQNLKVSTNHVLYSAGGTAYLAGDNINAYGIYVKSSLSMAVNCNLIEDAGRSLVFDGGCTTASGIYQNTLSRAQEGLVLLNSATTIGVQGGTGVPSNNYWVSTFSLNQTYSASSATNTTSKLFVSGPLGSSTCPTTHGGGATAYVNGTGIVTTTGTAPLTCGTPPPIAPHVSETKSVISLGQDEMNAIYKLYPNPNNGNMVLDYSIEPSDKAFISLFDLTGKLVGKFQLTAGNTQLPISLEDIPNGIYVYKINVNDQNVKTEKLIIVK